MKTLEDIKGTLSLHRKDISEEFRFMSLEEYLETLLGLKVDLISKDALKPRIGAGILREVVYV